MLFTKKSLLSVLAVVALSSCSSKERGSSEAAAPQAAVSEQKHNSETVALPPKVESHDVAVHAEKKEAHVTSHHDAHHGEASGPVKNLGVQQLTWLKNGNARFSKNNVRNDFKTLVAKKALLEKLGGGQKPHSIVLSCSDSRVPPELVFDQVMGEIFVIRVAGEALDSSVIASIEYAVEHLGSQLIVVLGHESCGAVKAAITTPPGQSAGSESLDRLVADIRPRIQQSIRQPVVNDVLVESWANAKGIAKDLQTRSPILSARVLKGQLKIVSALYRLRSGVVDFE